MANKGLDRVFNPRTVAVVGDKRGQDYFWLKSLTTFQGKAYSVQVDEGEIPGIKELGFENYASLLDIPEPVDYVIVSVPRKVAPLILEECIRKGVGGATFFTSGFAETDTQEGISLQNTLTEMAREAGFNLIGPNCMGIFNPSIGLRFSPMQYHGHGGKVAFISQSGTHTLLFSLVGEASGVRVSKSVSFGNAVVLDSPDYMEYFAQDSETKVLAMYIEGVKDGRRFYNTLKETASKKPVLVWKGGQTQDGARAASSHTAALATSQAVWEAMVRQVGAININDMDDLIDTIKALLHIKPIKGPRMGLVAMTGGQSVIISDAFAKAGFQVPEFTPESYRELASFIRLVGASYRNPLDVSWSLGSVDRALRILHILEQDDNVDTIVLELNKTFLDEGVSLKKRKKFTTDLIRALGEFGERSPKPFFTIVIPANKEVEALNLSKALMENGIASYPTFKRGAQALRRVADYYQDRSG